MHNWLLGSTPANPSMTTTNVFHAPGLHMHWPPANLQSLIGADPREAKQRIECARGCPHPVRPISGQAGEASASSRGEMSAQAGS